jgi:Holliday junction resolvase-like predicted endonuclease
MEEFLRSRVNYRVGQFDHITKQISLIKILEAKSQRKKKGTLGEP